VRPIYRSGTPLHSKYPILYIFPNIRTDILNMLHALSFFSSKCRLFHNANFSGACIIRILHTGCAKIFMSNSGAKRLRIYIIIYISIKCVVDFLSFTILATVSVLL
jgi:hypothetical protein